MERIYDFVFFKLCSIQKKEDAALADALHQIHHLDLCQLTLSPLLGRNVFASVDVFAKISRLRTPVEKICCLMDAVKALTQAVDASKDGIKNANAKLTT